MNKLAKDNFYFAWVLVSMTNYIKNTGHRQHNYIIDYQYVKEQFGKRSHFLIVKKAITDN